MRVALEVRRLCCCVLSAAEARRLYNLTEADLKALPGAAKVGLLEHQVQRCPSGAARFMAARRMQAGAERARRATHRLLDVLRVARAKQGMAQGMAHRHRGRPHRVPAPCKVLPPLASHHAFAVFVVPVCCGICLHLRLPPKV